MKNIYKILFAGCLLYAMASCSDDNLIDSSNSSNQTAQDMEGEELNVCVENSDIRTRDIDFEEGAPVRINTFWLGVFNMSNGDRVAYYEGYAGFAFLASGQESYGIIRHKLPAPTGSTTNLFMVAVVNYQNVKGYLKSAPSVQQDLSTLLNSATTWDMFNNIGVDTESAYDGDHSIDAPIMAGFLNKSDYNPSNPANSHIRIDQFDNSQKVNLRGATNSLTLSYSGGKYQTSGYTLLLRRLVSNFNVNIHADDNISITKITYKKFNVPSAIYIIERSMLDNNNTGSFPTEKELSPNFADILPSHGYNDDDRETDIDIYQGTSDWSFSFQHFANKHWARKNLTDYAGREVYTVDGNGKKVFSALATTADDINNNASYFEIYLHIIDKKKNSCANATLTIHEGYTSNADGTPANREYRDFSCARNMNYTYNINVHGLDNISFNVTGNSSEYRYDTNITTHRQDQQGKVWNMKYVGDKTYNEATGASEFGYDKDTDNFKKYLSGSEKTYEKAIILEAENPNVAFRIYGYNSDLKKLEGFNYNFAQSSFDNLDGLWPPSIGESSHYFNDYNSLIEDFLKARPVDELEKILQLDNDDEQKTNKRALIDFLKNSTNAIDPLLFETFQLKASEADAPDLTNEYEDVVITNTGVTVGGTTENPVYQTWNVKIPLGFNMNQPMNVVQFMMALNHLERKRQPIPHVYDLIVSGRDFEHIEQNKTGKTERDFARCFYIIDRNGKTDEVDGCSTVLDIYAAIQGIER